MSETKRCPIPTCERAGQDIPISEFPRNRTRPDGYHLYCKQCSLAKTNKYRFRVEAMEHAKIELPRRKNLGFNPHTPAGKVRAAIADGQVSWEQIQRATKLSEDEISDLLADLMLDRKLVGSRIVGSERTYFLRKAAA